MSRDVRVCVIGAGPAGLAVSRELGRAGVRHDLIDENPLPGGNIHRQSLAVGGRAGESPEQPPDASIMAGAEAIQVDPDRSVLVRRAGRLERRGYDAVFICAGACDGSYPRAIPDAVRVTTVGALQALLKGQRLVPTGRIALVGAGPLLHVAAADLRRQGAVIAAVCDRMRLADYIRLAPFAPFMPMRTLGFGLGLARLGLARAAIRFGCEAIVLDDYHLRLGRGTDVEFDVIGTTDYLAPQTQLARTAGCRQCFSPVGQYFHTCTDDLGATSVEGIYVCGEGQGIFGAEHAAVSGTLAAQHYLVRTGVRRRPSGVARARLKYLRAYGRALERAMHRSRPAIPDGATACECEGVPVSRVREAIRFGLTDLTSIKGVTRCGMGLCQGRYCEPILSRLLGDEGLSPREPFHQKALARPVTVRELLDADV